MIKILKTMLSLGISILKNKTYMTAAKEVWAIVDETFRITDKVENKLKSKAEEFNGLLLAKFPELTADDLTYWRQAVAGEINKGKDAVLNNDTALKQLQEENEKLKVENASLTEQLNTIKSTVVANTPVDQQTPVQA
ncbi:hypothetical protein NNC19_07140 [Clostridium sp. SHJSY1]|uniref:hypothetical protein n=1 Tax=Clostridium sp. SHJSY1 TaxID=2942483 RepID=UPI002875F736|nr:hypothetical protein [Clostridium sp. SHJSY1]MDS0525448.1 hypothetical protein [Clostridium sp. SHJSY1]